MTTQSHKSQSVQKNRTRFMTATSLFDGHDPSTPCVPLGIDTIKALAQLKHVDLNQGNIL